LKPERTITEAASLALQRLGKPSSIREIFDRIISDNLYTFNTPVPEHVLQTEIRCKTLGIERVDSSGDVVFKTSDNQLYELMKETVKRRAAIGTKRIQRASDKEAIIALLTSDEVKAFRARLKTHGSLGFKPIGGA
jgi:hypothetical protein